MSYFEYFRNVANNAEFNNGVGGGDPLEVSLRQSKLIYDLYPKDRPIPSVVLDYGCGIGRTIPTLSILWPNSKFIGIDISIDFLNFSSSQKILQHVDFYYKNSKVEHYKEFNTEKMLDNIIMYDRISSKISADFAYAYSVLTHLNELEANEFFADISSSLKIGGIAIISCFILDAQSISAINNNTCSPFRFNVTVDEGSDWFEGNPSTPGAFTAFGLTNLEKITSKNNLSIRLIERGTWRMPLGRSYHDMITVEKHK